MAYGDNISRQAAIDAFDGVKVDEEHCTEYDIGYNDGIDFAVSRLSVLPPAQPQRTDTLKAGIKRMKRTFTVCINSDYYTGYMSALSAVEGYIAQLEGDAE